jgi:hypothetical protein
MNDEAQSGEQLKLEGIARATRSAWTARALWAIATLARSGRGFTGEDVVELAGAPPSFRAVGAAVNLAMRRGMIQTTGATVPARDPRKHRHRNLVWEAVEITQEVTNG